MLYKLAFGVLYTTLLIVSFNDLELLHAVTLLISGGVGALMMACSIDFPHDGGL